VSAPALRHYLNHRLALPSVSCLTSSTGPTYREASGRPLPLVDASSVHSYSHHLRIFPGLLSFLRFPPLSPSASICASFAWNCFPLCSRKRSQPGWPSNSASFLPRVLSRYHPPSIYIFISESSPRTSSLVTLRCAIALLRKVSFACSST